MIEIDSDLLEQTIYNLCIQANTAYDEKLYNLILQKYENAITQDEKIKYTNILNNIKIAFESQRPLCQDTGQVVIFVKIGRSVFIKNKCINNAINSAVEKAYTQNFYRKSVVTNAIFDRTNTQTNTPALIYTDITDGNDISVDLTVKGAGSENCSAVKMFKPTDTKEDIFKFIQETIQAAGEKSCPPMVLGIGIGGTLEYAAILSKKAFFHQQTNAEDALVSDLKNYLIKDESNILDIKVFTSSTHIACLPVAVTINCHCSRHASAIITSQGVQYQNKNYEHKNIENFCCNYKEISTDNIEAIKALKAGENILLTGEIYTARDAAHKKFKEYFDKHRILPIDIKNKIIFYAGPCPAAADEVIGPVGPTTSFRMDKYCALMHSNGLLASIGKGERSSEAIETIKRYNGKYFTAQGGIACVLAKCVHSSDIVAFEELGTEAVRKLYVEKLPVKVII